MMKRGLAFKLVFRILLCAAVVFAGAFTYDYYYSREIVAQTVRESARNLTYTIIYRSESMLNGVEKVPFNIAALIGRYPQTEKDLFHLLRSVVENNSEVFGSTIAFEPHAFDPGLREFAPYCYRSGDRVASKLLGGEDYRYWEMDWYIEPKKLGGTTWSEPYYDRGGGDIIMSTFSAPFHTLEDGKKAFKGVVTADISLAHLREILASVKVYESGHAFVISRKGLFVTCPDEDFIMKKSIFDVAAARGDPELEKISEDMVHGGEGFAAVRDFITGKPSRIYYSSMPSTGWSVGVVFPEEELFRDVRDLAGEVILIGLTGFALLLVSVTAVSRRITEPLRRLDKMTHEIAGGNFDVELPDPATGDEIGRLTRSFKGMTVAIKKYIADLAETTAARERMESELKIARRIQMSFLSKDFPDSESVEIHAVLEPAREIGGDFYDFHFPDKDHLFFAVGDVSGKGIPAALFMAAGKTLLKGVAEAGVSPSQILRKVNAELCVDNESMMFVTVFCALLNLKTGELLYSNGGHLPPLVLAGEADPVRLPLPPGPILGVFPDAEFHTSCLSLRAGNRIVAYTDGVTEAMNEQRLMYSEKRLVAAVRSFSSGSPKVLTEGVLDSVRDFSGPVSQSDDITILSILIK